MVVIKRYLEFKWDIQNYVGSQVMSEFIELGNVTEAFRLSAKFSPGTDYSAAIGCFINDIAVQKAGTKIQEVWCAVGRGYPWTLLNPVGYKKKSSMLLASNVNGSLRDQSIWFRFFVTGSVSQYDLQHFDSLLAKQLWDAATGKKMTDVECVLNGHTFYAHKFILASRSPVFKVLLGVSGTSSSTNRVIIGAADPDVFQQFLHFLYTGQLSRSVSEELSKLAVKYQVDTLIQLCQNAAAVEKDPTTDVEDLFGYFDALGVPYGHSQVGNSGVNKVVVTSKRTTETFTTHHAEMRKIPRNQWISGESGRFRYKLNDPCDALQFRHDRANKFGWDIFKLGFRSDRDSKDGTLSGEIRMIPLASGTAQRALQAFHGNESHYDTYYSPRRSTGKYSLEFTAHLTSTVDHFDHQLRDTRYAEELWSSAVNKEGTDIEFRVGDRIFSAHQALLVARCPALALLAPNDEGHSEPIPIDNVDDPSIFEDLLYFIYTGMIRHEDPSHLRRFLEAIAVDLFPMETLGKLRRATTPPEIDKDVLSNALLSIFT